MTQTKRVIVADPDASERARLVRLLGELGKEISQLIVAHEIEDGPGVSKQLEQGHVDLLVMEALLDGESGLAILRRIKDVPGTPPVVFVTHMTRESDRYWALRNGAHAYVMKPYDAVLLKQRIGRLLSDGVGAKPERP